VPVITQTFLSAGIDADDDALLKMPNIILRSDFTFSLVEIVATLPKFLTAGRNALVNDTSTTKSVTERNRDIAKNVPNNCLAARYLLSLNMTMDITWLLAAESNLIKPIISRLVEL
jgi:energy-converting hydrogenase Eha subunit H